MKRPSNTRRRGFTLTELMVSLVMGLIVSLAAVGLSRTATTVFHEQARSSTTEMSLRVAADRLRQDLMRTSYMSTGNIALDPKVARLVSALGDPAATARYAELVNLRGINVDVNMAQAGGIPPSITANGIKPDAIELVGNFTTDDAYSGTIASGAGVPSGRGPGCANAQTITLDPSGDAATFNLGGGDAGTDDSLLASARAAFMPAADGRPFLAQVTDAIGCNHYVPVCDVNLGPKNSYGATTLQVMVAGSASTRAVLYSNSGAEQGPVAFNCGSSEGGRVMIAPISRVRWRLRQALTTDADPIRPTADIEQPTSKVDLVREVLDFNGGVAFTEIVAEYAVDLKFGIVVDDPTAGTGAARQKVFELDTDTGNGNIDKTTSPLSSDSIVKGKLGPQDVRSVRFRIAVRTSVADREADLPLGAGPIRARYCVDDPASCKRWARVRTVTSEVALTNQAGMTY